MLGPRLPALGHLEGRVGEALRAPLGSQKRFDSKAVATALGGAQSKRPSAHKCDAPARAVVSAPAVAYATPLHELYAALGLEDCHLWLVSRWWPERDHTQPGRVGANDLYRLSKVTSRDLSRYAYLCPNPVAHDIETALRVGRIADGQTPCVMVFEIDGASIETQLEAWGRLYNLGLPEAQACVHSASPKVLRGGELVKRPTETLEGDVPAPSLHMWFRVEGLSSGAEYSRLHRAIVEWAASHGVTLDRALGQTNALVRLPGGSNVWADGHGRAQALLYARAGSVSVDTLTALVGDAWTKAPERGAAHDGDLPEEPGPLPWIVQLLARTRILDSGIRNEAYMILAKACRNAGSDLDVARETLRKVAETQGSEPGKHDATIDYHVDGTAPFEAYARDGRRHPSTCRIPEPTPGQPLWSSLGAKYGRLGCLGAASFAAAARNHDLEASTPVERWDALWRFYAAHQWGLEQGAQAARVKAAMVRDDDDVPF